MLTLNSVSIRLAELPVLDQISFTVNAGDRLGLIGPNGSGKTTLLAIMAGRLSPGSGSVSLQPHRRVGLLRQGFADLQDGTLGDLLDEQLGGLLAAGKALSATTAELADTAVDPDRAMQAFEAASEAFEHAGGYRTIDELESLLARFGLAAAEFDTPLAELSGGEKTRAGLAALLATRPDVLLLDEPTNHLDIDALQWLEAFVRGYQGAVVIVSHDRTFLDATVSRVFELDPTTHRGMLYAGTYSDYLSEKRHAADLYAAAFDRQQRQIERIERDVRAVASHAQRTEGATTNDFLRGRAKKVARTAKVRERKLERLLDSEDKLDKPERRWGLALELESAGESGRDVLVVHDLVVRFGDRVVLNGVDLHVTAGERIALTGTNGSGKTTLLRAITGRIPITSGEVRLGANVLPGWFSQEHEGLRLDTSALSQVRAVAPGEESEARAFLHKFLFTGESVRRPAQELSYGERARLALALLVRKGANLLLLDEPLNHLDLQSRERFEQALLGFEGTTIAVLHDRYAISRIATHALELVDGKLIERPELCRTTATEHT